ncbi:hypothetical protein HanIR_Chr04g0150391 [Helianthus annuus]|nr:hypothetical protein HanIR_Chr04g0150391 [Helianthus annuus]
MLCLLLGTLTYSLYVPAVIFMTNLLVLLLGAASTAACTVVKFPFPFFATITLGLIPTNLNSFLSLADNHSGHIIPFFAWPTGLLNSWLLAAISVSVMLLIIANTLLHIFPPSSWSWIVINSWDRLLHSE